LNRSLDIAIAVALAVFALPLVLIAAICIASTSRGRILFLQERIGRFERPFRCCKLRTMYEGTKSQPTHEVGEHAVMPVGRWLRRLKFDELPQLWNVLRGDMSLVGPRPCLPGQLELIRRRRELGVYGLRPGMTGLSQVRGIDMSAPEKCALTDVEYLKARSLSLDVKILFATLTGDMR
jgi:O-antigen biosynthesis protein WbqP